MNQLGRKFEERDTILPTPKMQNDPVKMAAYGRLEELKQYAKDHAPQPVLTKKNKKKIDADDAEKAAEQAKSVFDPSRKDRMGFSSLCRAAQNGHHEIIEWLLDQGADVESQGPDGSTPLHYACAAGHEKVAQVLLKAGAHADTKNSTGSTPLHNAARTGSFNLMSQLLDAGADINCQTASKWTPLHVASSLGNYSTVAFLCAKGADVHCQDRQGSTPMHFACKLMFKRAIKVLLETSKDILSTKDS